VSRVVHVYGPAVSTPPAPAQLQELVDSLAAATGAPATLEDRDLNLVASSGHDDVIDEVRRTSILRRRSASCVSSTASTARARPW